MSTPQEISPLSGRDLIDVWRSYEDIAMHFNELQIRIRTQALGAIATVVTAAGFFVSYFVGKESVRPWPEVAAITFLLTISWCTLWYIDVRYYSKLLRGAVNALLQLERESKGAIFLSTKIENMFVDTIDENGKALNWPIYWFYVPVFGYLIVVFLYAAYKAWA